MFYVQSTISFHLCAKQNNHKGSGAKLPRCRATVCPICKTNNRINYQSIAVKVSKMICVAALFAYVWQIYGYNTPNDNTSVFVNTK